ncbi:MAG: hypothetical protein H6Q89_1511 [Myxococcaceae bacterium]|nr:hypothetical protein [Myxococcaceae bacterium]
MKHSAFTIESQGYDRYLFRRAMLPKIGWAAGAVGALLAVLTLIG